MPSFDLADNISPYHAAYLDTPYILDAFDGLFLTMAFTSNSTHAL